MSSLAFDSLADRRDKHALRFVTTTLARKIPGSNTISTYPGSELNVANTHLNIMDA